ncbi:MAG: YihY/virulence factor BrkB family protein [Panacagrimonas sp.]
MHPSKLISRLRELLWREPSSGALHRVWLLRLGRYVFALIRDLFAGELSMRAMSLVYTTLLSLVPLLALAFSVLKALGVHNRLEPVLLEFLRPLGEQSETVSASIIGFVERIQVGVLGSLGVALLFYTAFSLIQKVESSFNFIWRIERPRPFAQRVGEYLSILMVGPVIIFSAQGLTYSILNSELFLQLREVEPFGLLLTTTTRLIPYALIIGMFIFMYAFMPNTRVKLRAALVGGLVAGVLWQTASLLFASFVSNANEYNAVYSSFAIFIFLLIWLHVGWLILLIGCQLAFYVQHPEHLKAERNIPSLPTRELEYLALLVMSITGQRFIRGEPGMSQEALIREIAAEPEHVCRAIQTLLECRLLTEAGRKRTELVPARDLASTELADLWREIRAGRGKIQPRSRQQAQVLGMLDQAEQQFQQVTAGQSLRQWLADRK